jgi:hypothetical protein
VDEMLIKDTNYTYRVTAYISGMYQNTTSIDTTVVETVNTSQMRQHSITATNVQYAAAGGVLLIVVIVGTILIIRAERKTRPRKKLRLSIKYFHQTNSETGSIG